MAAAAAAAAAGAGERSSTFSDEEEVFSLQPEQELRIEYSSDNSFSSSSSSAPSGGGSGGSGGVSSGSRGALVLKLLSGSGEVFGAELAREREYEFTATCKFALFTWEGCRVLVRGPRQVAYVSDDTPMVQYVNAHGGLDGLRLAAQQRDAMGPRAMVVGPVDTGKSTLCRVLVNYGIRAGWQPTFVDLDVGQGSLAVPGVVAATPVQKPTNPTIPHALTEMAPYALFYGHASPSRHLTVYKKQVDQLCEALDHRLSKQPVARHSGVIINTCGWVDGEGYDLMLYCAMAFRVDVILVVGQERLWSRLKDDPEIAAADERGHHIEVSRVAKSGGVVSRDASFRRAARAERFREYFYGHDGSLTPMAKVLSFSDAHIYRTESVLTAPAHALPIGAQPKLAPTKVVKVEPTGELKQQVLAVSYASREEDVMQRNVAGFVHVVDVDEDKQTITVLAPSSGPLPSNFFVAGDLRWADS